jgi:orotidine-5'-phosphate decarboxylase
VIPYVELLRESYAKTSSMLCLGMDPVLEKMKIDRSRNLADEIVSFFVKLLEATKSLVSAVKPNVAFYHQYGLDGIRALAELTKRLKAFGVPLILDAKNADIGRTSAAYAKYLFDFLGGDAVTLNPYMGYDSLEPFFAYREKGFYVLALTSNEGARDLQTAAMADGRPLYERTLEKICGWGRIHRAGSHGSGSQGSDASIGAVLGATQEQFASCVQNLSRGGYAIPLLVPGVGAQGGSYGNTETALERAGYEKAIVRINASSTISYAHEKYPGLRVDEAAAKGAEEILRS